MLIFAIEWDYCECCILWLCPNFLRPQQFLFLICYEKLRANCGCPRRFASTRTPPAVELLLLINLSNVDLFVLLQWWPFSSLCMYVSVSVCVCLWMTFVRIVCYRAAKILNNFLSTDSNYCNRILKTLVFSSLSITFIFNGKYFACYCFYRIFKSPNGRNTRVIN